MKKTHKWILVITAFLVLLAMLLLIPQVSNWLGGVVNKTGAEIRSWAQTAVGAGVGILLLVIGVQALAVPALGIALIVIGLALITYAVWPLFSSRVSNG